MKACASIAETTEIASKTITQPLVLVNGVPESRLSVSQYQCEGPLDQRTVELIILEQVDASVMFQWRNSKTTVAQPTRLSDGQVRYHVLAYGRMQEKQTDYGARGYGETLALQDHWSDILAQPIQQTWWHNQDSLVVNGQPAKLLAGAKCNRSSFRYSIGEQQVHVLSQNAQPWTILTALQTISAFADLNLQVMHLPSDMDQVELIKNIDLARPLEFVLADLCNTYGLTIHRQLTCEGSTVVESRSVRTLDRGRRITLTWAGDGHSLGQALQIKRTSQTRRSQLLIAEANGWRIESTFNLVKGWRSSLEGMAGDCYNMLKSDDFSIYHDVYRLWALNEDGRFSNDPFNRGHAYDLSTFFNQPVPPQPLAFLDTLIVDDKGLLKAPIIEMSVDGGQSWTDYPGSYEIETAYAAVYLSDPQLPDVFLAAAQAGLASIRVTASLQSPIPVRISRWTGNPFAGCKPAKIYHLGDRYPFQRIDQNSIHYGLYADNSLAVAEYDTSRQLRVWLLQQARFDRLPQAEDAGQARLQLPEINPRMHIGDRVQHIGGPGLDGEDRSQAVTQHGAMIEKITCRWPGINQSADGKGFGSQPGTTVYLRF